MFGFQTGVKHKLGIIRNSCLIWYFILCVFQCSEHVFALEHWSMPAVHVSALGQLPFWNNDTCSEKSCANFQKMEVSQNIHG